jgi:AcrR family transcriptional regulator
MARRGLDRAKVIEAAAALADREGLEAVALGRLAGELGVRPPSLYNHVEGLDGVLRGIALRGVVEFGDVLAAAAVGRSGADALRAMADAMRRFARTHPGRYAAAQRAYPDDAEIAAAGGRVIDVFVAVLRGWDLEGDEAIHAVRVVRSALHGFVALELNGGFGMPLDLDETYDRLVDVLARGLER